MYPQVTKEWLKYMIVESHNITKNNFLTGGIDYNKDKPAKVVLNGIKEVPCHLESCPLDNAILQGHILDEQMLDDLEENYSCALKEELKSDVLIYRFIRDQQEVILLYKKLTKYLK